MVTTTPDVYKDLGDDYPVAWDDEVPEAISALPADTFSSTDTNPTGTDVHLDVAGFEDEVACFVEAFSEMSTAVSEIVAEGDRVLTLITYIRTHEWEFLSAPADGNTVEVVEFRPGRIEESEFTEMHYPGGIPDLLQQLDVDLPIE